MADAARCGRALMAMAALLLAGCAATPSPPPPQPPQLLLLGEVHDNAAGHALQLQAFVRLLDGGARPALALEQLDRTRQPQIDALLAQRPLPDAAAFVAATGGGSWNWAFYTPFIELALRHGLPIVAANVARDEARAVMQAGLAASGFDASVPEPLLLQQATLIEAGHCGMLDAATARRMALAQVARDQFMARVLQQHAARGVVLLAGNGHVRTDIGAPAWLAPELRARSRAVGVLEEGDATNAFDARLFVPPQPRPDPCSGIKPPGRQ